MRRSGKISTRSGNDSVATARQTGTPFWLFVVQLLCFTLFFQLGEAAQAQPSMPDAPTQVSQEAATGSRHPPTLPQHLVRSTPNATLAGAVPLKAVGSDVALLPGFNLISIPDEPPSTDPAAVLGAITGQLTAAFAYDACDTADPWKLHDPADPAGSDLTAVDHTQGLWINVTSPAVLPVTGTQPAITQIQLCTGWNLIGYPLAQARPVSSALASITGQYVRVLGFELGDTGDPWEIHDVAAPAWANDLQLMQRGRGYWVLVTEDTTLDYENTGAPPAVEITVPGERGEVTAPTDVIGTVESNSLDQWTLSYRPSGEPDATFVELGTGNVPGTGLNLGPFDPTMLLNGMYDLRLEAVDFAGQIVEDVVTIVVDGEMKVGKFSLSFTDLVVPLSGLDIEVIRTYDSRDKVQRDFGFGWTLDINRGSYKNNRVPGEGWEIVNSAPPLIFPCVGGVETQSHLTTVRLSDREVYRFRLEVFNTGANLGGCFGQVRFAYVEGPAATASLEILGNTDVLWSAGSDFLFDPITTEVFNPTTVRLKTHDGREFDLRLDQGVERIRDANGNEIQITPTSISHSSGTSIVMARDAEGRITQITDPAGEDLAYTYDSQGDLIEFADREGHLSTFTYDSNHGLVDMFDPLGNRAVRSDYDDDGRLISTTDSAGNTVTFANDLGARRQIVTNRLGRVRVKEYNERGDVVRETDEEGGVTTRTFDGQGNVLSETDPVGSTTVSAYDGNNNVTSRTDPLGKVETFTYNSLSQVLTHTDRRGGVTQNVYDADGNLLSETDPDGNTTQRTFDAAGNELTRTNGRGFVTTKTYDPLGNMIRQVDPLGRETTFTYDVNGNRLTETQSRMVGGVAEMLVTTFEYDSESRLIRTVLPDGSASAMTFDGVDNLVATTDPLGRLTTHEYDQLNRRIRSRLPDGTSEQRSYDAESQVVSMTDRQGRTTQLTYDGLERLIRIEYSDGSAVERTYDAAGRVLALSDENGHATTREYDAAGRMVRQLDALGRELVLGYDDSGNLVSSQDANGETTSFEYDGNGLLLRKVFPDGTEESFIYDEIGQPTSVTDQAGIQTQFVYDNASTPFTSGGQIPSRLTSVIDALNQSWTLGYDEIGNRVSQTDPNGNEVRWEFDELGRVTREILPLGMSQTFIYDASGNLASHTDFNGDTIVFAYDAADRLIRKTFPGGVEVRFTYTGSGQLATVIDSRGTTVFTYDARDRLLSRVDPDGGEISYTYDLAGNVISVVAPSGTTSYAYDALNRPTLVTDPVGGVTGYSYDVVGRLASVLNPNGTSTVHSYDAVHRLTRVENRLPDLTVFSSHDYSLGPAGHRLSVTEDTGRLVEYTYDATHRLLEERITDPALVRETIAYTYDAVGNRLTRTAPNGTVNYTYDANDRLLTAGGTSFTYDANGNTLTRDQAGVVTSYGYDVENRLLSAQEPSRLLTYQYDHEGVRVSATVDGVSRHFLVDKNRPLAQVLEERDGAGLLQASYVYGLDLISQRRAGVDSFYHYDALGSTRALTDASGAVTDSYVFGAFGNQLAEVGSTTNSYRFAGEQFDSELDLYYLRARYLDTATGRFSSVDPVAGLVDQPQTLQRYNYALSDPVNLIDPSGEFASFSLPGISVTLSIQGNVRTISAVGGRAALQTARRTLSRVALRSVRALKKIRPKGQQTHHVLEQRLWKQNSALRGIFKHVDDMPGINLNPAQHQAFTNAWRAAFPYRNQAGHIAKPTLEQILTAAQRIYAKEPAIWKSILLAVL